jgi:hypothetical protein
MLVSEFDDVNFNLKTGIKARYNIFMRNLADFLKRKLCNFPNIPFIDTQDFHGPRRQVTTLLLCKHFFRLLWKQSWAQRFELESDAFHFTQKEGRFNKTLIVLKLKGLFRPPPHDYTCELFLWNCLVKRFWISRYTMMVWWTLQRSRKFRFLAFFSLNLKLLVSWPRYIDTDWYKEQDTKAQIQI